MPSFAKWRFVFSIPAIMLVTKKGSQQMMKTPITVPRVFAALVSFANLKLHNFQSSWNIIFMKMYEVYVFEKKLSFCFFTK